MYQPRVKICCISSEAEAKMAIEYGAAAVGLVGNMPSGPGVITDELIFTIAKKIPPPVSSFLLTSETKAQNIIAHYKKVYTTAIQIVDDIDVKHYAILRQKLLNVKLVKVIHVINEHSIDEAIEASDFVDAILLDSGNPTLAIKELGGTGRTHNWMVSKKIRQSIRIPLFLAGGLNKDNVKQAIDIVEPFGVDVCSGVRTNGNLDEKKLEDFFKAIG